ncbi:MAG: T9SS type A sorting domain-containing protein [Crocinitomicaceae bacterium]
MKSNYKIILSFLALSFSTALNAQLVSGSAYMRGEYVEVAISERGREGAPALDDPDYHFYDALPIWGFMSNPAMDDWASPNGDFFAPGTPECGFGLTYTLMGSTVSKGNNYDIFEIPGEITDYTDTPDSVIVTWEGIVDSLQVIQVFELKKDELFYRTTVTLNNLGSETFTDVYFYDSVDPDNNQQIGSGFATDNTIISQSEMADDSVIVLAEQTDPYLCQVFLKAYGPEWKVGIGGFTNRDGEEIWNATGPIYGSEGYNVLADVAIAIAHKTEEIAPGKAETTFSYLTAFVANTTVEGEIDDSGIEELNKKISIYPNPTTDKEFTIQMEGEFNYTIIDVAGRVILTGTGVNSELINLEGVDQGIYLIRISQDGKFTERKIQVN